MAPDSVQHHGALVLQRRSCKVRNVTQTAISLAAVPTAARALRVGAGIVVFLACLISVGCAGGLSSSTSTQTDPSGTSSISGTVSPAQNGSGAALTLSGAASATTTADASGNFTFSGLGNGSYTVGPSKPGFTFSPAGQNVTIKGGNVTAVNFAASAVSTSSGASTIYGAIIPAANGSGATVTLSGTASATTTADASGNYSFTNLASGSYTVTPTKSGFNFSPGSQSATIGGADVPAVNFNIYSQAATVNIYPGTEIASVVKSSPAGTAFVIHPGMYRLTQSIIPKNGDSFFGQTACAPPTTSCPAILSGSTVIGPLASFDGTNYKVTNQTQQGTTGIGGICDTGWEGCIYPEDLFFDGVPYKHLYSSTLPTIGPGQWWFDYTNHIIYFHDNPSGHTVETSVLNNAFGGSANNVTIQYLTVEEFASMYPTAAVGVSQGTDALTQGINWTIENCELTLNHSYGARVNFQTQILNNYVYRNGQTGIGGGIGVALFGTLTSSNNGNTLTWVSGAQFPTPYSGEIEINVSGNQGSIGIPLTVSSCSSATSCTTTTSPGNNSSPIMFSFPIVATQTADSGVLIQGNTVNSNNYAHFDPGFGAGGIKTGSTSGMTFRGNTVQNNYGAGIHFDDNSQNELVDGNIITDNTDADGLVQEIGYGTATFRNNFVARNGAQVNHSNSTFQIAARASSGVSAYCNVVEISSGPGINGWSIGAADRGYNGYPPYQYLTATDNSFHHNTVIWDAGASGAVGFFQNDAANQPNFFADNTPPDFNTYHMSSSTNNFVYDDNNSQNNLANAFANYQANGADVHGSADANSTSGYPTVAITSPADQSSFTNSVTVAAAASDASGISQVEFYVDWALQATVTNPPYKFNLTSSGAGPHTVAAMAYSSAGIRACYAVTLNEQ